MTTKSIKNNRWLGVCARYLAAAVLIGASLLKVFTPSESALLIAGYGIPYWSIALLIQAELALACLFIFGLCRRQAHVVGAAMFLAFAAFSLYRALAGYESCGCFGSFVVTPWITFLLDMVLACLLLVSRPQNEPEEGPRWMPAMIAFLLLGSATGIGIVRNAPSDLSSSSGLSGGLIILEPEEWIGKEFPLLGVLEPSNDITQGEWTVLIYHHGCPDCEAARPRYQERVDSGEQVLLVEAPPFAATGPTGKRILGNAWLPDDREWFVQAPVEIKLSEGNVTSAKREGLHNEGNVP